MKTLKIEMSREFKSLGYFTPEEVRQKFAKGDFNIGDFGRYEDSGEWRPVEVVLDTMKADPKEPAKKEAAKASVRIVEPDKPVKAKVDKVTAKESPRKTNTKQTASEGEIKKKRGTAKSASKRA